MVLSTRYLWQILLDSMEDEEEQHFTLKFWLNKTSSSMSAMLCLLRKCGHVVCLVCFIFTAPSISLSEAWGWRKSSKAVKFECFFLKKNTYHGYTLLLCYLRYFVICVKRVTLKQEA